MSKQHFGKCALCGKETTLTFEHIPPKKALNSRRAKIYTGDEVISLMIGEDGRDPWDADGLQFENQQSGMGLYSLCSKCNSFTGAKYGQEYVKFAIGVHKVMRHLNAVPGMSINLKAVEIYPLRFIKQVISMFLSINTGCFDDSLRKFVLEKESLVFDKGKYRIFMYLLCCGQQRLLPYSSTLKNIGNGFFLIGLSEITTYPLGFIMTIDQPVSVRLASAEITNFCEFNIDQKCLLDCNIPAYECNTLYPLDYRSKEEITRGREESKNACTNEGDLFRPDRTNERD